MLTDAAIFQNAWIVPDLAAAMAKWSSLFGVGPFYVLDHLDLSGAVYRGRPSGLVLSVGLAQAGPVQIELIQQHNEGPSLYREVAPDGRSAFHHICIYSHDFPRDQAAFEAAGCEMVLEGGSPDGGVRFAYFDTRKDFDLFTEVITPHPFILRRNELVRRAAVDWDGRDPVRILESDGTYSLP
ncbi:MAG TPA: VOC family protein [Phenylobacterium sp.]|nr:VOC family protein [Phenylobacterium sp.]